MFNRFNQAKNNYYKGGKKNNVKSSPSDIRHAGAVAAFLIVGLGLWMLVSTVHPWYTDDIKSEAMSARMVRVQEVTAAYGQLAPWLAPCNDQAKNPATCYFGTPDKNGVTPISKLMGDATATITAGKSYDPAVAFGTAMNKLAKTNVKRLPKVGTDRAAWMYVQHADDKGYVVKGTDVSAPMCESNAVSTFANRGEGAVLIRMARCYNIALYQGYNRLKDAQYPPSKYIPGKAWLVILGLALLAGGAVYRGGGKKEDSEDTAIIPVGI